LRIALHWGILERHFPYDFFDGPRRHSEFGNITFVINGFEYTMPNDDWVEKALDVDNG
jgi:hypothetical protein